MLKSVETSNHPISESRTSVVGKYISRPEFVTILCLVIGATIAFSALLRTAIQDVPNSAARLAELAVGASVLHGFLTIIFCITDWRRQYTRFVLAHVSGALFAGSFFGGLASIWN